MRVAVFGAGYAGLTVARRLERELDDVELVVVDESGTHLLVHELHRLVRRPSLSDTITVPLGEALESAEIRTARVTDVDADASVATLRTGDGTERLGYDVGVVALGSETAFYDIPGLEDHAIPLKRPGHAEALRERALAAPEGEVLVGGAGLSGIQLAGELAALSAAEGLDLGVTLVEMADRIAPTFESTFAGALRTELEARDVRIETGATVESADEAAVHLADGRRLPYDVLAWTGGIRGPDALGGERRAVESDLLVGESTFVVGDAADVVDAGGTAVPASAQTALRQADVAAKNVRRLVNGRRVADEAPAGEPRLHTYTYESAGWVVSVGDGAVARVGPLVVSGDPARAAKAAIGAGHLGSVGAIEEAAELVREELGWPAADAVDFGPYLSAVIDEDVAAGAADLQTSVAGLAALADEMAGETVDLTPLTRPFDHAYPGSHAEKLGRLVTAPLGAALRAARHDE